jgi:hypothetical protein
MCDVAAQALKDMQIYFANAEDSIEIDSNYVDIFPRRGYSSLNDEYSNYLSIFNSAFTDFFLGERNQKITDHKKFMEFFIEICTFLIKNQKFPLTRTGFLSSKFCSPFVNGLVVDLYEVSANDDQNIYDDFIKDLNYEFFIEAALKFSFKVDKKIPWRLIFDLNSPLLLQETPFTECGVYREVGYFKQFDIKNISDFFSKRFFKTMIGNRYEETTELYLLKVNFLQFYNNLIAPNTEVTFGKELLNNQAFVSKISRKTTSLEQINKDFDDTFWLKLLLYFRALETNQKWNQTEFNNYYSKVIVFYKNYGLRNAVDVINLSTKNIFDLDKTQNRMIDREKLVNKIFTEAEGFRF